MPKISFASARVNAKLTMEEAAEKLNVSKATLCKWENGKTVPRGDKIKELSALYNIPLEYLDF